MASALVPTPMLARTNAAKSGRLPSDLPVSGDRYLGTGQLRGSNLCTVLDNPVGDRFDLLIVY